MRWLNHHVSLLALPVTLLASIVAAVPSPTTHYMYQDLDRNLEQPQQRSFHSEPPQPKWREWSSRLVERVFGAPKDCHGRESKKADGEKRVPPSIGTRYGDQVVLRFNISEDEEATSLAEAADTLMLDVWEYSQDWVDIRLSKDIVEPLLGLLPSSLHNSHLPLLQGPELAQAVHDTYQQTDSEGNLFFADYQPYAAIDAWMRLFASFFSTHVRTITLGTTYEGRRIPGLRVGVHPTNSEIKPRPKRKTILVVGGLHAREWVSTSTVNYIAYSLITGYGKDRSITSLLEAFDFVFVPTVNPDGYVYTWETDRLWRKNRQPTVFRFCQGIDLDKSFDFQWEGATSSNPCSESFAGDTAFQGTEARALADWAKNETEHNNVEFIGFLDLHSYSQQILYPYAYTCDAEPPGLENLEELAFGLEKAIRVRSGHSYEVMPACEGNLAASNQKSGKKGRLWPKMETSGGSALDWFYHEMKVRYAYQIKLRDRGTYGFLLPKEQIVPTGKEVLEALLYFGGFLGETFNGDSLGLLEKYQDEFTEDPGSDVAAAAAAPDPDEETVATGTEQETRGWIWRDGDREDPGDISWELKKRRR
ncbi:putative metallocarboxypeptidase ECM14 [Teratosphaeria destructans]|uniref:Inactive metallocarboxypeptidase ECM14 n=1 Tax=Teratosphaeria destructans TaxID=418781 RepID=A0A9W7SQX9_9PEZI|nr:putative metallocarboxypeptidase ECM14 [Teratosphaeria destructans]